MESSVPTGKPYLTRAQKRALKKARSIGYVMINGGFSGVSLSGYVGDPLFDGRMTIEWLVRRRLLWPGERYNQYVLTDAGRSAIAPKRRIAHARP